MLPSFVHCFLFISDSLWLDVLSIKWLILISSRSLLLFLMNISSFNSLRGAVCLTRCGGVHCFHTSSFTRKLLITKRDRRTQCRYLTYHYIESGLFIIWIKVFPFHYFMFRMFNITCAVTTAAVAVLKVNFIKFSSLAVRRRASMENETALDSHCRRSYRFVTSLTSKLTVKMG